MEINNKIFVARQPILGKNQDIYGYELFSRSSKDKDYSDGKHDVVSDSKMLFNIVSGFGLDYLLGGKIAFLNCTVESLMVEYFDLIAPDLMVLEIPELKIYSTKKVRELGDRIKILKEKGYRFACDEFILGSKYKSWLPYVNFVKIQASKSSFKKLVSYVEKAQNHNIDIIADKVETEEQYKFFKAVRADLYQGYYFCRPTNLSTKINHLGVSNLIKLINLTIKESSFKEIDDFLKTDPSLSEQLLKYINSIGIEEISEVHSFEHALSIMGYGRLFKWLTVLFSTTKQDDLSDMVSKKAIIRSRFMELLGEVYLGEKEGEKCFVVGMFSLLDTILNVPLKVAVESMDLEKEMTIGLLERKGKYAVLLGLVEALERNDWIEVLATAKAIKIPEKMIHEKYNDSVDWANKLGI